ncbi:cation-translocating P-type ATPase [Bradyrhizobium manausense]|uniref:cation-translocating P-type ATPase n=1 Tax=Bradyrhizobium TaxID=374 RepID=UPI001BA67A58|nr:MULTISPECIES: cation-translocating P-type ATPase [Bradyrhizobium]MBR0824863.1 cation-translocating P-type ATPase [Bradyrhizobium manausense]UVO29364.1 cation-translocating P-type ATPase [Bradyrhizobium arachidis]
MLQTRAQPRRKNDAEQPAAALAVADENILKPVHREPVEAVLSALGSDATRGLSSTEAQSRLDRCGPNQLKSAPETPWWRRLAEQFENLLVIILLVATAISVIEWLLQDPRETLLPYEAIVILAIVVLNALLGYLQEARAERSVRALMALAAPESTAIRDGERQRVPAHDIVPGDIVLVEAGDRIPADARIIESSNLHVDEATLTGESVPATKMVQPIDGDVGLGDRRNMLFASTVATYGRGRAVVVATGMRTEVGRIAGLLEAAERELTPLQQELDRTGRRLSAIMLGICAVVFATGLLSSPVLNLNAILSLFLFAVALAVAAIPEALPAIVTIGLSLGVRRMAAAHAIVRKLPAVETLGAATVICSDKTGTLTRNEMTVRAIVTAGARVEVGGSGYVPDGDFTADGAPLAEASPIRETIVQMLRAAALANDAVLVHGEDRWRVQGDPTEGALIVAARKLGIDEPELARFPRIAEIPFTSERKRHTTVHVDPNIPGELRVFVKGAPEVLLAKSDFIWEDGQSVALDDERRVDLSSRNDTLAGQALRTLAVATRTVPAAALGIDTQAAAAGKSGSSIELPESIEDDLLLLGLVGLIDPPRAEVKAAVAVAKQAHIRTVMITGDHPATAVAIARELDIFEPGARTLTGVDLRTMSDAELDATVEQVRVFARVDPEHKLRIVSALQRKGHIVAMTGDGINDAPALKTASIGVAMGITGTDVSKEAADMVLTDDNFASIVKAIEEGRGIYDNIQKYLIYLLSTNSGELLTMFAGVMMGGLLGLVSADAGLFLPLLAVQLLWINLITDGPPALALGVDPKDRDVMMRQPRRRGSGVLLTEDWIRLACVGVLMMFGTLVVLDAYYPGGLFTAFASGTAPNVADEVHARTMAFTTLMLFQLFDVYNCRSRRRSAFGGLFENKWLIVAVAFSLLTHVLVIYVPALQTAFHTVALSALDWLIATGVAATLLIGMELAKVVLRRKRPDPYA